jgi:transcriptional regulator with XRE-family HTH domain
MIRTPEGDFEQELRDPEYVRLYGASDAKAEIAVTLAEARHAARKTQKELAEAMSLSQPYIARLEGGEANPTIGTIGSLLAILGFRLVTYTQPLLPQPVTFAGVSDERPLMNIYISASEIDTWQSKETVNTRDIGAIFEQNYCGAAVVDQVSRTQRRPCSSLDDIAGGI